MAETTDRRRAPHWLDGEEMDAWMQVVALMTRLPAALDAQLQRDSGISHFEFAVMARLSESPQRTQRLSTLATLTNGSLSRLSHVITRLERRGWVRRETCPHDGRYTNGVLTDQGYAVVAASAPGHVEIVRRLVIDVLDRDELKQLQAIGHKVVRAMEADEAVRGR